MISAHLVAADALLPARNQMALSLGSHIILACFGVAFPAIIFALHRRGLRGDASALELAKRWSKIAGVLFAIGAVSGTILSFEMGLLWPGMMEKYGDVLGTAFALEGISFFIEAIFLGIYVYGWDRLPPKIHVFMLLPMILSGIAGSFFVISVNAWMNSPSGFTEVDGVVTDVDPIAAIFNDAVPLEFLHMFLAAYMVTGFTLASVYAVGWLRGRRTPLHRLGILVPLAFAAVATPIQPLVGHFAGQRIADDQPIKFAAIEGLAETESSVETVVGGIYRDGELTGEITIPIPGLASFLAQNDVDAEIIGLDSVPEDERPPVNIVRAGFQVMVGIGMALVGLITWAAWRWRYRRDTFLDSPWMLRGIGVSGVAAIVAMEAGWITTEVGRQPWIVYGLMRTEDAVTDGSWVWASLTILVIIYVALGVAGVAVLRSMSKRWEAGETDLASPYGPSAISELEEVET